LEKGYFLFFKEGQLEFSGQMNPPFTIKTWQKLGQKSGMTLTKKALPFAIKSQGN